jgi:hypothetical protein
MAGLVMITGKKTENLLKFIIIFVLGAVLGIAAISWRPGWGPRIMAWGKDSDGSVNNPALAKNAAEQKVLGVLAEIKSGPWKANVATLHGRLLRILTEAVNARKVVEKGNSGA